MFFRVSRHIHLHYGLVLLLSLSFFTPYGALYRKMLLAALWHEGWHFIASLWLHVPVRSLAILPYGCMLRLSHMCFEKEAYVTIAGPVGSLLAALLFFICGERMLAAIHFYLFCFNLLPALPLDGGRLLRLFLWKRVGFIRGNAYIRLCGKAIAALLCILGLFTMGVPFFVIAAIILSTSFSAPPAPSPLLIEKRVRKGTIRVIPVSKTDSLLHLLHFYSPFYYARFCVLPEKRYLSEQVVSAYMRKNGVCGIVADVQKSLYDT